MSDAIAFSGQIHLITSDRQLLEFGERLKSVREFGFDTETRPSFRKGDVFGVSLLQLATDSDAYLFRLQTLTKFDVLKDTLEDNETLKVGAAIRDDLKGLQRIFKFKPQNFTELQDVAKAKGLTNFGLKGMTEEVLQMRLSKKNKLTNWDARVLTNEQLLYAATDAWIGLKLFRALARQT